MKPRWQTPAPLDSALDSAEALQRAAAELGFDWPDIAPVWDKLQEEIDELRDAVEQGDKTHIAHELGDVLFSVVNLARFLELNSTETLAACNARFAARLRAVQTALDQDGGSWQGSTLEELEAYWQRAKST